MDHQNVASQQVGNVDVFPCAPGETIDSDRLAPRSRWLPEFPQLVSAVRHGGLAVFAQALFAGSHFLVNIILARWLPPQQYGAFALAYACYLLFLMVYSACIYEPLVVFGAGRYREYFHEYVNLLGGGSSVVLAVLSAVVITVLAGLRRLCSGESFHAFLALAVAAPFVLTSWFGRGGLYAQLKLGKVAVGGAIYCAVLIASLVGTRTLGRLSPATGFLAMGAAGLAASCFFYFSGKMPVINPQSGLTLGRVAADHWKYGRWAVASAAAMWFPDNVYYAVLTMIRGLEGAAAFRALVNLINPAVHTSMAICTILIPLLIRHRRQGGAAQMSTAVKLSLGVLVTGAFFYFGILELGRSVVFRGLYAGRYDQYSGWPLFFAGLVPVAATVSFTLGASLRALEKPNVIFWCYLAASVVSLVAGLPLTVRFGVVGAAAAFLLSNCVTAGSMLWFFAPKRQA